MQIHELNTGTPTDADVVAVDNGTDTFKATAEKLVPPFTSGDASSPASWTNVSVLATGTTLGNLLNAISTMIKNVRWLYSKLGTTDISSIGGGTVTGALDTYAKDSGWTEVTFTSSFENYGGSAHLPYRKIGKVVVLAGTIKPTATIAAGSTATAICTLPTGYRPSEQFYLVCHGSTRYYWLLNITTGGSVTFARYGGSDAYVDAPNTTWLPLHAVFFVD